MKITKIFISNYRSIKKEEINSDLFNIFVGQNNHGKTNLFEAIDWFFNGQRKGESIDDIRYGRSGSEEVCVEITFSDAKDGAEHMRNATGKTKMIQLLGENDEITVRRSSLDLKNRILFVNGQKIEKPPTGFDNALNDFLPKFEYVDTKKYYEDLIKFGKKTPISLMLSGVLEVLLEENEQYKDFRKKFDELFGGEDSQVKAKLDELSGQVRIYLQKQFPECVEVEFVVNQPSFDELLKNFSTTIDDGIITDVGEKGDGMQRALMLAIIQTYADYRRQNEDIGKSFLFFIDEAELHLHPSAQRNLKNALLELSQKGDQVFLNTHSSVFVADEADNQKIFKVEKTNKQTSAKPISIQEKQGVVYELLGGSPSDLLLPRNFMIVEGKSEEVFLNSIMKKFYSDKPPIQIIFAGGDLDRQADSMNAVNTAYVPLGQVSPIYKERLIILCDKSVNESKENNKKLFLKDYPHLSTNNQFFDLPEKSLEEYFPPPWKKSAEEVKKMDEVRNEKVIYARDKVAQEISKKDFEEKMKIMFEALVKCWELSYK